MADKQAVLLPDGRGPEVVFQSLSRLVDGIVDENRSAAELLAALHSATLPSAYKDMLAVLTAEGIRKRCVIPAYQEAIAACANPLYRQLWSRWLERYPVKNGT
jgi:hypothetical protein